MTKTDLAAVLGVSTRHVGNLVSQRLVMLDKRGHVDVVGTLGALFVAAQERSGSRRARDRLVEAQMVAARLRGERIAKRFLSIDEVVRLFAVALNRMADLAQSESSVFFSELVGTVDDTTARIAAGRMLDKMRGLFLALRNGVDEMRRHSLADHLNQHDRVENLLARYVDEVGHRNGQTDDQGETRDEAPTAEEVTGRLKRPRVKAKT